MNWERIAKAVARFFLIVIEYSFKVSAAIATLMVLGTPGTFKTKFLAGFNSLTHGLRQLAELPSQIGTATVVVNDYSTQTAQQFTETHGADAVNALILNINEGAAWLLGVGENLGRSPFTTIAAGMLVFLSFYVMGWVIRFSRQRGRGSYLVRMERKLGERIFGPEEDPGTSRRKSTIPQTSASSTSSIPQSPSSPSPNTTPSRKSGVVAAVQKAKRNGKRKSVDKSINKSVGKSDNKKRKKKFDPETVQRKMNRARNVDPNTLKYMIESARAS